MSLGTDENTVVGSSRCPECAAKGLDTHKDNLIEWKDGHRYCFACHYYEPASAMRQLERSAVPVEVKDTSISMPSDASSAIEVEGLTWLNKYGITRLEILKYKLQWSPSRRMLIFPFYGQAGNLIAWQARCFLPEKPKYYTKGNVEDVFWIVNLTNYQKRGIILVEDCISAIKVGRYSAAMPLLGSNLSSKRRNRLAYLTDNLIFWLDYDKAKESCTLSHNCQVFGMESSSIITDKDPKDYSDEEIRSLLTGVNY